MLSNLTIFSQIYRTSVYNLCELVEAGLIYILIYAKYIQAILEHRQKTGVPNTPGVHFQYVLPKIFLKLYSIMPVQF